MTIFLTILLIVFAVAILALHTLSAFGQGRRARIATYCSLASHILLFINLLLLKVSTENTVLVFLTSVLVYSAFSAIRYKREKKANTDKEVSRS